MSCHPSPAYRTVRLAVFAFLLIFTHLCTDLALRSIDFQLYFDFPSSIVSPTLSTSTLSWLLFMVIYSYVRINSSVSYIIHYVTFQFFGSPWTVLPQIQGLRNFHGQGPLTRIFSSILAPYGVFDQRDFFFNIFCASPRAKPWRT